MLIDDFQSGFYTKTITSGVDEHVQHGMMLGGTRQTNLLIDSALGHPGTISVGTPGGLAVSTASTRSTAWR